MVDEIMFGALQRMMNTYIYLYFHSRVLHIYTYFYAKHKGYDSI